MLYPRISIIVFFIGIIACFADSGIAQTASKYHGGANDGVAGSTLAYTYLDGTTLSRSKFFGGNFDGIGNDGLIFSFLNGDELAPAKFAGGSYDGHNHALLFSRMDGQQPSSIKFAGGGYDGVSHNAKLTSRLNGEAIALTKFFGGSYDGGYGMLTAYGTLNGNSIAATKFSGGSYDGVSSVYSMYGNLGGMTILAAKYSGGSYDGFTMNNKNLITLNGMDPAPSFAVNPLSLTFGRVYVDSSKTDSVTITNNGTADLILSASLVLPDSSQFSVSPVIDTIPPLTSAKFFVNFQPSESDTAAAMLLFEHNATGTPDSVSLGGRGVRYNIHVVGNTNNDGPGSLRQAIFDANSLPGMDTIRFSFGGGASHYSPLSLMPIYTIDLDSVLPEFTDPIVVDGTTVEGYSGVPLIELNGTNAGGRPFSTGALLVSGGNSLIRGLIINRFATDGISIRSDSNVVENCYIGTDNTGMADSGNAGVGISIVGGAHNRIGGASASSRNVISGNEGLGIRIMGEGSDSNLVVGNYIGTNYAGTVALGNFPGGMSVEWGTRNRIGGPDASSRNIISGNYSYGIYLDILVESTMVQGNFVGTDVTGNVDLGNGGTGISVYAKHTLVGGSTPGSGNLVSGNDETGIQVIYARGTVVEGNSVGTNVAEDTIIGNTLSGIFTNSFFDTANYVIKNNVVCGNGGDGIHVGNMSAPGSVIYGNFVGANRNENKRLGNTGNGIVTNYSSFYKIGGAGAGEGNVVANNGQHGVLISNTGVDTGNTISRNSIYANGYLGIKHGSLDYIPTPNDSLDPDTGPNSLQNYPVFISVERDSSTVYVAGILNSYPNANFTLEFFTNDSGDASGFGEGKNYVGSLNVTTDAAGDGIFFDTLDIANAPGDYLTATATDTIGNTSEFSQSIAIALKQPCLSVKNVSIIEGNAGSALANFSIDLAPKSEDTVIVEFATMNGTALSSDNDFLDTAGTLLFLPDEDHKVISVVIYGDTKVEPDELFSLRLVNATNGIIEDSLGDCAIANDDTAQTVQYGIRAGWNLVSIPVTPIDPRKTTLYPTATSTAFSFSSGGGYAGEDTLREGTGYWLKFAANENIVFQGTSNNTLRMSVNAGWNMIGSISEPVWISGITSNPSGIVTSQFFGYNHGYVIADTIQPSQGYWVKVNQDGELIVSSMASTTAKIRIVPTTELPPSPPEGETNSQKSIPDEFALSQNYPNPFNPATIIRYRLPEDSYVTLKVHNILGEEIATLVNEFQASGFKSKEWDASGLPSGTYYYKLNAGKFQEVRKMILLR